MKPTPAQYEAYQRIFDYYNERLFNSSLPSILLSFSRKANSSAFFAPEHWQDKVGGKVHLWQQEFGKPSRRGYHNKEWAVKMEQIGLMPSHTGEVGGKKVGQRVTHYVIPNGFFEFAFSQMPPSYSLPFRSLERGEPDNDGEDDQDGDNEKSKSKVKFSCPSCTDNAWGKPTLLLICGKCQESMVN